MTQVAWQDRYAIALVTSMTDSYPDFDTDAQIGLEGDGTTAGSGKFVIPVTEHPHLTPGSSTLEKEMALGLAERHQLEYTTVASDAATVTLTMPANQYNLSFFAGLFFQVGASEAAGATDTTDLTCIPYTTADPDKFASLVRQLSPATIQIATDATSHVMRGCVCNSLTLTGEEGDLVMMTVELMGYAWNTSNGNLLPAATIWSALDVASTGAFYKYEDMIMSLAGTAFKTPNFSVTMNNNMSSNLYNSTVIQKFLLGRLTGEGTFAIPWGATTVGENVALEAFLAGTTQQLKIYNNAVSCANTDGDFYLDMNAKYIDTGFGGDDEVMTDMSFSMVKTSAIEAVAMGVSCLATVSTKGW